MSDSWTCETDGCDGEATVTFDDVAIHKCRACARTDLNMMAGSGE